MNLRLFGSWRFFFGEPALPWCGLPLSRSAAKHASCQESDVLRGIGKGVSGGVAGGRGSALREETERVAQYAMTYLGETDARKVQRLCV